ncbi:MAG: dihydroorotate dehydrogenase electron transfer subunit [Planctomycetes bacterium]|nr:dihydroorotate dehydrogenase electron transfer subunit [Planctomycetota bacterium]
MEKEADSKNKGMFSAAVAASRKISEQFYKLELVFDGSGAQQFARARAGQFAELDLANCKLPQAENIPDDLKDSANRKILLRRPFSFSGVQIKGDKTNVEILYCAVGPATLRMTTLEKGDCVSVLGPLGNGFSLPNDKSKAVLVAGGSGAGPIMHLAKQIKADSPNVEINVFVGAATREKLPFENCRFDKLTTGGVKTTVATDDGSAGDKGFVTDCVSSWLNESATADENKLDAKETIIYGCGPEAMLEVLAKIAERKGIDCEVSMERMMACGFGVCQGCAVECKIAGGNETIYKMCCKDGPVFDAREIVFKTKV